MEKAELIKIADRMIKVRSELLEGNPFFGRLLLRLALGLAECGTAYTDMRKVVFDPKFAYLLSDREIGFVMMHEVMHCVLKHCVRANGKLNVLYNIACDIVVNSIILEAMGIKEIEVAGETAMHLAPDGKEGREYNAEQVYEMLLNQDTDDFAKQYGEYLFDSHEVWKMIEKDPLLEGVWDSFLKKEKASSGKGSGIPESIERYISDIYHTPKISWKQVLHDYIQKDRYDYVFSKPDKRYCGDLIMPSFQEDADGSKIEKIYFFIDTSASVSNEAIAEAFAEIKDAIEQIGNLSGNVLFFDTKLSTPLEFEDISDIETMKPIGGGGTDFEIIFKYVQTLDEENCPSVIVIITDGYARFPDQSETEEIPVVWLIVDSDVESPWGECLHIFTEK